GSYRTAGFGTQRGNSAQHHPPTMGLGAGSIAKRGGRGGASPPAARPHGHHVDEREGPEGTESPGFYRNAYGMLPMRRLKHLLQLAALFDCVEDVQAWVKDRDGRYCWVNRAFRLNYTIGCPESAARAGTDDPIGKTDYDLSPAFLADQFRLDDDYVLTGKRIVNRIELVGTPDGLTVWNVTNKIPLADAEGAIVGTAGLTKRLNVQGREVEPGMEFGPVLAHMRDHYHSPISNKQLAQQAHLSVRAFERKFRGIFHLTPQKYLRKLRMRMASRALVY